jgi:hypothetical protein
MTKKNVTKSTIYIVLLLFLTATFSFTDEKRSPIHGKIVLQLEKILELKGSDDNPDGMLTGITDLGVDSDENLYILDNKHAGILKFDTKGSFLKKVGRKGQGPSDIIKPHSIIISDDGHFYVYDRGISRISKFTCGGSYIDSTKMHWNVKKKFFLDKMNNIYAFAMDISNRTISTALLKFDRSGKKVDRIVTFFKQEFGTNGAGGVMGGIIHKYTPRVFLCVVDTKHFAYGNTLQDKITVYNTENNTKKSFDLNLVSPRKISSDELDHYKKKFKSNFKMFKFPSNAPFFQRILCDEKGRFYIVRFKPVIEKTNEGYNIDIFSRRGEYLYRVKCPHEPWIIKNGKLYTVQQDDEIELIKYTIINYKNLLH